MDEPLIYHYDPDTAPTLLEQMQEPGVTSGWVYIHNGIGPARVARCVGLSDGDHVTFELTGDFEDCEVVEG